MEPKANILLVDDQPANLLALEAVLTDLGHNLVKACSGEEALERLLQHDFAVILLDVQMPALDGFDTARQVRSRDRGRHTPIIFLTSYQDDRFPVEQAYTLGAVDYLVKPLVPVILRAKVAGFIELFQKAEQIKRQAEQLRQIERQQHEQRLAEENTRFRIVTEHSSDAVTLVGPDGTILYSSPASRRVLGYEPGEFLGRSGFEIVHPDDQQRVRAVLAQLVKKPGATATVEERVRHKDGSWRWVECVGTNLLAEPTVRAVVVNYRDITERRLANQALRESQERFARFMQHLPGLAWVKDHQGRYVYVNDAAEKAFRVPRERLYGRRDDEVFPQATAAPFKENDRRALASETGVRVIETLTTEQGELQHSIVSRFAIPGPEGEAPMVGGIAIDITDRIEVEAALKEADRRKDEFLAMLAHELRNPLGPIRNAVQVMKLLTPSDVTLLQAREMIERQVQNLTRLVDDLLDVSRITRGKVSLHQEPVELAAVINRSVETSRPLIEANRHTLTLSLPPESIRVVADPTRLEQVFSNLLNNAAKYTERGGSLGLTVRRQGDEVLVNVRDTGFGIPAELLPHVFDLFTQADSTLARSQGGLGIGLTLVQSLVEMHGGRVTAHSDGPGKGSEFVVSLPICADTTGPGQAEEQAASCSFPTATCLHILVVDDNADAAESLAMLLRLWGHAVRTSHDGQSGLKAALSYRPDVVFLDIGLPGLDGYEVARRLREEFGETMRLVALTGYGQQEDRRRAEEVGFDDHLTKPADPAVLHGLLARAE
jgi:PAS domain S-box-containing protein